MTGWRWEPSPEVLERLRAAATEGLEAAAEHIMETSQRDVPVRTGDLKRSGETKVDGLRGVLAYKDPISIIVHEDTTAHHTQGGAKFLENAMNSERTRAGEIVAATIREKLGT